MDNPESGETILVPRIELLRFLDEKPEGSMTHAGSIVNLIGEDLNTACFIDYLDGVGAQGTVINQSVTTGKGRGPRLDRWLSVGWPDSSRTVFQTEIKSWSAHAYGGEVLPVEAGTSAVAEYRQRRWDGRWDERNRLLRDSDRTRKVLVRMKPPPGVDAGDVRPLLIFWEAIGPRESDHLFKIPNPKHEFPKTSWPTSPEFPELWVFSVSSYLRSIEAETLTLRMPSVARRLRFLQDLLRVGE